MEDKKNTKTTPAYLMENFREKYGKLIKLTDTVKKKLKKRFHKEITDWKEDTVELHSRLIQWNELMENIVEETDFPFKGASNIHIPIVAIFCKVYHSVQRRSILGADIIWYMQSDDERLDDAIPEIEMAMNYKACNVWNIKECLSDVFHTTNRDGLGILQIDPVIETETVSDVLYLESDDDFLAEFPDPESANMSDEEWMSMRQEVAMNASVDTPVEIPIEEEKIIYWGPRGEIIERADFVTFPATASDITRAKCRGYGKRFYLRKAEIRRKVAAGEFDKEEANKILKKNSSSEPSDYMRSKEFAQGISRSGKRDETEFFQFVYWYDIDGDGKEEKLLFVYNFENDVLLEFRMFPFKIDNYAFFRISKKPGQMDGESVVGGLSALNEEIDTQHNQRINSRTITQVPSFKAKYDAKEDLDLDAMENQWRPGVVFWLKNFDDFEQFAVQPTDLGSSIQEEQGSLRYCTLLAGIDPFVAAGLPQSDDPQAPGNKTIALIAQSNMRMDDPLSELRSGVEQVGKICLALEYQFGPQMIEYRDDSTGKPIRKQISKKLLRGDIRVEMHGVTVTLNPEAEFTKWMTYYKAFAMEPVIAQNVKRRTEALRQALRNGRVPGRDKILPSIQELEQEDTDAKAMVLMRAQQMQQQQQAQAAQQAQQEAQKQALAGVKQKIAQVKAIQQVHELVGAGAPGADNGNS